MDSRLPFFLFAVLAVWSTQTPAAPEISPVTDAVKYEAQFLSLSSQFIDGYLA